MVRSQQRILLIGDAQHEVEAALRQAAPGAEVRATASYFDGIAELSGETFNVVVAAAEPIERRPEAAVRTLRELAGSGKIILFGYPAFEAISRKMLAFGCDDYVVTPVKIGELQQVLGSAKLRIAPPDEDATPAAMVPAEPLPLAEILLDALLQNPALPLAACAEQVSRYLAPDAEIIFQPYTSAGYRELPPRAGAVLVSRPVVSAGGEVGRFFLYAPGNAPEEVDPELRGFLARLAALGSKVHNLNDQQKRLQKLAITDELTGVFNRRYFKHFLTTILERARVKRFWVTLLLFDIDHFKKYNDEFGHGVGDEILRETAAVMRRCVREHDLVARIGGDEFAVIFWDKEGPRQPKASAKTAPPAPARPPQEPQQIFDRFKRLISSQDFPGLGPSGQGTLTISGGLANYPWDGRDPHELIQFADHQLMFGAKKQGKNTILLVGRDAPSDPS